MRGLKARRHTPQAARRRARQRTARQHGTALHARGDSPARTGFWCHRSNHSTRIAPSTLNRPQARATAPTITAPTRSRSSKGSRPSASGRPCTSARRALRPPPPGLRGRRQLDRRGARRLLRPGQRHDPQRQLGHRRGQRPRHSRRHARDGQVGRRGRPDGAARRRQVRERRLQGLGRPARRRRVRRQRAVGNAGRSRSGATARSTSRATSAGSPTTDLRRHRDDEAAGHEDYASSPTPRSSRRSSSASTRWRTACASSRS